MRCQRAFLSSARRIATFTPNTGRLSGPHTVPKIRAYASSCLSGPLEATVEIASAETRNSRRKGKRTRWREECKRKPAVRGFALGIITVLDFLFLFFFLLLFLDRIEFERIHSNHFKFGAAFGTRDDFALVAFIFFNVHVAFALWTKNHNCLRSRGRHTASPVNI